MPNSMSLDSIAEDVLLPVSPVGFTPVGAHVSGTDISSATTLTPPEGATKLLIGVSTKNARYTLDGTAPTANVGLLLYADDPAVILPVSDTTVFKIIEVAATALLNYQWGQ